MHGSGGFGNQLVEKGFDVLISQGTHDISAQMQATKAAVASKASF